jgi:hypothetical protein
MVLDKNFPKAVPIVIVLTLVLAFPFIVFGQAPNSYKMTGKIRGIDLIHQTIVIDVPLGSRMFTVGGPLAPAAKLTQNGQPAKLKDFSVNEQVTVIFHSSDQGHLIDRLMG